LTSGIPAVRNHNLPEGLPERTPCRCSRQPEFPPTAGEAFLPLMAAPKRVVARWKKLSRQKEGFENCIFAWTWQTNWSQTEIKPGWTNEWNIEILRKNSLGQGCGEGLVPDRNHSGNYREAHGPVSTKCSLRPDFLLLFCLYDLRR